VTIWDALGWGGTACFFTRFLLQWLQSERAKHSVTPASFWWLSLCGSLSVGACAWSKGEWVLLPAFAINTAIYLRNLWMTRRPTESRGLGPIPAGTLGLAAAAAILTFAPGGEDQASSMAAGFLVAGWLGQAIWGTRFVVQWWFSERRGKSHFPVGFWWFTLAGSVLNLLYTSQLESVIFLVGYLPTPIYPIRNLMLGQERE